MSADRLLVSGIGAETLASVIADRFEERQSRLGARRPAVDQAVVEQGRQPLDDALVSVLAYGFRRVDREPAGERSEASE